MGTRSYPVVTSSSAAKTGLRSEQLRTVLLTTTEQLRLIRCSSGVLVPCTENLILTPSTPSFWTQPGTEKGTKLIVSGDKTGDSRFDLSGAKNLGDTKAKWEVHDV